MHPIQIAIECKANLFPKKSLSFSAANLPLTFSYSNKLSKFKLSPQDIITCGYIQVTTIRRKYNDNIQKRQALGRH